MAVSHKSFLKKACYALYKAHWITELTGRETSCPAFDSNRTSVMNALRDYYNEMLMENNGHCDRSFHDWLEEQGFSGTLYVCYSEFCANEFQDREFMHELLGRGSPLANLYDTVINRGETPIPIAAGETFYIEGDASDFWLNDYTGRVSTEVTVVRTPEPHQRKVLVNIDTIDGDRNVLTLISRSALQRSQREKAAK